MSLSTTERERHLQNLLVLREPAVLDSILGQVINQDIASVAPFLPRACVDLLIMDPPYNMDKIYNSISFSRLPLPDYETILDHWLQALLPTLAPHATIYICGDWRSSPAVFRVASRHFKIRNRITWEREKGRGAKTNWKNCSEDIWFCTLSNRYTFCVDRVKLARRVIAPYRDSNGRPRDWKQNGDEKIRLTCPSNFWSDISVPFWSMAENTNHPTQKPEKLIAKLILASSEIGDVVFDPFLGSGTTAVAAQKLRRRFFGVELDPDYCCLALKRLHIAKTTTRIQGYDDGVFWERNSPPRRKLSNGAKPLIREIAL